MDYDRPEAHDVEEGLTTGERGQCVCKQEPEVTFLTLAQPSAAVTEAKTVLHDAEAGSVARPSPTLYTRLEPYLHTLPATQQMDHIPPLLFLDECFRGAGQCLFQNNPLSGACVMAGVAINSRPALVAALVGLVAATATAHILVVDKNARRNGLFGFSGFLMGAAMALFHYYDFDTAQWLLVPVALMSALSVFATVGIANFTIPVCGLPPLGAPFLLVIFMWLMGCTGGLLSYFPLNGNIIQPRVLSNALEYTRPAALDYTFVELIKAVCVGMGNTAFSADKWTGVVFLAGVLVCSPISAAMMLCGSVLAVLLQLATGVHQDMVSLGLLAFNCILSAIALGGTFLVLRGVRVWLSIFVGIVLTFVLTVGLTNLLSPAGLPVLGLPFTIAVWVMLLCARGVDSLMEMPLNLITTPERNMMLYACLRAKKKAQE
eukprot:CAMPEP_0177668528 /NCGR_PEP_ID=MMETSP0447-20121125/22831_1 /TAXON_ID=0 /ORGANISM="Stygamoeba regulata, Strain BSH-02190019" /LENGTH=431 /DNA_ID=CAMNT_0019175085 /DNA_START=169 /DNA_END=1464 /DNA_ORIENTATION=-